VRLGDSALESTSLLNLKTGTLTIVYKMASHFLNIVRAKGDTPLKPRRAAARSQSFVIVVWPPQRSSHAQKTHQGPRGVRSAY
jgi:hypothetical protein